jgi:hypothetical protein
VCGWFEYTVSLRCPHKKKSGGLKSGDRGGHNLFEASRKHRFPVRHGLRDFLNTLYYPQSNEMKLMIVTFCRSAVTWLLGSRGSNPARGMDVCLLCYVVLSCVGRGLCDGLISRPEESYHVSNTVWLRNLKGGGQGTIWAVVPLDGWTVTFSCSQHFIYVCGFLEQRMKIICARVCLNLN